MTKKILVLSFLSILSLPAWCADAKDAAPAPAAVSEPAPPPAPPGRVAYAALEEAVGADGVRILTERGAVIVSGWRKDAHVLHAQWPVLDALTSRAKDLSALAELCAKVRAGEPPAGAAGTPQDPAAQAERNTTAARDPEALRRIERMTESGFATAGVRAAAGLLASAIENASAMGTALKGSAQKPLPSLPWAASFWERVHGDTAADFSAAAPLFFREFLLGPQRSLEAERHFLAHMKEVRGSDEAPILQKDLVAAAPSQRTLDALAEYLLEQRRLWNASLVKERLLGLEKTTNLRKDLSDLSATLAHMQNGPDVVRALRFALQGAGPEPRVRFSGADLHAHLAAGEEPFDVGDEAVVSLAYWVEGLTPKESVEVTEASFLDEDEGGAQERGLASVKRAGGGPYTVSLRLPLRSPGRKTFRVVLASPDGAIARRSIDFQVSPRLEALRAAAAEAETSAGLCRLEEASKALAALEAKPEASVSKPQFRDFLSWLKPRRKAAAEDEANRKSLLAALDGVRLHASKEQCDFRSEKARRALETLAALPAGCDRLDPAAALANPDAAGVARGARGLRAELEALRLATDARRANQDAFRSELERARKLEASCRHEEAAEAYAASLALLDSDGEARCGAWETEYTAVRLQDLPRASSGKALSDEIDAIQERAARRLAEKDAAGALALMNPLIARIDTLESRRCYQVQRRKAEELALAAGVALAPGDLAATRAKMPKDSTEEASRAVSTERQRLDRIEAERREREAKRQEPSVRSSEELPGYAEEQGGRP
ncbi:MAG: hypothetical protein WC969_06725 [Elusimicrobiota bacterium]